MNGQEDLLRRLKEKDEKAMQEFVQTELPRVFNLCFRLCQNRTEAEDLSQDVFVKAFRGIKNFDGKALLSTWLYRITVNAWKNHVRHQKSRKHFSHFSLWSGKDDDGDNTREIELPEHQHAPDTWTEITDDHKRLMHALHKLDEDEKEIIVLRDIEDKTYDEVADLLEINVGTVKSRLSRAREKLRQKFYRMEGKIV